MPDEPTLYEIRIVLEHARPPVWRRVRVDPDQTLGFLHAVIQRAVGWHDGHMHAFERGPARDPEFFRPRGPGFGEWSDDTDEEEVTLRELCPRVKDTLRYEYDFGDAWRHRVTVSKEVPGGQLTPVCLSGKGACPPEDCGGVWGYADLQEALGDPDHPEHEEMVEWHGPGGIDPEAFSLAEANRRLGGLQEEPGGAAGGGGPSGRGRPGRRPGGGPGGLGGPVEAGLEWEGFLVQAGPAEMLAGAPPEAQALIAAAPTEALPPLWCAGFRESGAPRGFVGLCVSPDLDAVLDRCEEGVLALRDGFDQPPALPERLLVGDRRMLDRFPRLAASGVPVEYAESLADAPGLAAEAGAAVMSGRASLVGGEDEEAFLDAPPMIEGHGVRDDGLRAFHAAAATFATGEPWRWFPPDAFLEVLEPKPPQGMKLFAVHRGEGGSFAVNFVKSLAQARAVVVAEPTDAQLTGHLADGLWSFDLSPLDRALPVDVEEAQRLGLDPIRVGGVGFLPTLALLRADGIQRASRKRLGFVTALLHAVAIQSRGVVSEPTRQHVPLEVDNVPGVPGGRFAFRPREFG